MQSDCEGKYSVVCSSLSSSRLHSSFKYFYGLNLHGDDLLSMHLRMDSTDANETLKWLNQSLTNGNATVAMDGWNEPEVTSTSRWQDMNVGQAKLSRAGKMNRGDVSWFDDGNVVNRIKKPQGECPTGKLRVLTLDCFFLLEVSNYTCFSKKEPCWHMAPASRNLIIPTDSSLHPPFFVCVCTCFAS